MPTSTQRFSELSLNNLSAYGYGMSEGSPSAKSDNSKPFTNEHCPPPCDPDNLCMVAMAEGDVEFLKTLIDRWQMRLINFFYRALGNRADAEDLAQECFIDLYRAAPRYRQQGNFKAFLFTLARRRLIDRYRRNSRRPLEYRDPSDFRILEQSSSSGHSTELEEAFHEALTTLPEQQRHAILLLQQQELSYEEIAEAMETSLGTVKSWIHRARQQLRLQLKGVL
ncbi:MAG: sigma-70 family RNA polymerase sigma factor [Opitutales bacterium]